MSGVFSMFMNRHAYFMLGIGLPQLHKSNNGLYKYVYVPIFYSCRIKHDF